MEQSLDRIIHIFEALAGMKNRYINFDISMLHIHSKVYAKSDVSTHALSPFTSLTKLKNITSLTLFYICEADQH